MFICWNLFIIDMNKDDINARAYNYYTIIEEDGYNAIDVSLWINYITWSNVLTGKKAHEKTCIRQLKRGHANLSDDFKKQLIK